MEVGKKQDAIKTSLRNLQSDYVDLYLIHWPGVSGLSPNDPENAILRRQSWATLVKLHKDGLLKSIGVSNYTLRHIKELLNACAGVKPTVNQVEWHPHNHDQALLDECRQHNILIQAHSPLGGSGSNLLLNDPDVLDAAKKLNVSSAQILLKWLVQQQIAVIPKAASPKHMTENIQLNFTIPDDIMTSLSNLPVKHRYDEDPHLIV